MASKKDEDHDHWPDGAKVQTASPTPLPRYDSHYGLYEHSYRPAGEVKTASPTPAPPKQDAALQYAQYAPYGQMPYMAYPVAPAYYGYGGPRK